MIREITPPGPISCMPEPNPTSTQLANRMKVFRVGSKLGNTINIPKALADEIILALENHDARVTELIRANSQEVIKRRVFKAQWVHCLGALQDAAAKFRFYARNHRDKNTPEADEKALVNDQMADQMEKAILFEVNPDDYGKA